MSKLTKNMLQNIFCSHKLLLISTRKLWRAYYVKLIISSYLLLILLVIQFSYQLSSLTTYIRTLYSAPIIRTHISKVELATVTKTFQKSSSGKSNAGKSESIVSSMIGESMLMGGNGSWKYSLLNFLYITYVNLR